MRLHVNLQALEAFCHVVRQRSFSRGAAALGISQSAASQLVAHLEEQLGFRLIDRKRRPLEPTREGRLYFQGSQEILHRHRRLVEEIRETIQALVGSVRVASIYSAGLHTLSRYIQRFMTEHEGARVRLEYFHPVRVYAAVLDDEADLGVVSYPRHHRELEVIPWLEERMVLACPSGHPLAGRARVRPPDLRGAKFVAFDRDLAIRREVDRRLRDLGVSVQVMSEFDNIETIKQALEISGAVSILPRPSIERELQRGALVERELEGLDLRRPVAVIRHRRNDPTPTSRLFLNSLLAAPAHSADEATAADAPGRRPEHGARTAEG